MEFNKQNILNKVKAATQSTVVMDEGLRAYMLKVYNYMATGVLLTGIIALLTFKMGVEKITSAGIILTPFGISAISRSFLGHFRPCFSMMFQGISLH